MFGKKPTGPIMLNGSITKGVSITHENLSTSNSVINNNINIKNERGDAQIEAKTDDVGDVHYDNPYEKICEPTVQELTSQNEFLKAILAIYMNQKLYFSGKFIVCTPDELIELIKLLTLCETVELEVDPIEVSCCGNTDLPYSKINNIWVVKDNQRSIFKYTYPQFLSIFDECKVSLKVVRTI